MVAPRRHFSGRPVLATNAGVINELGALGRNARGRVLALRTPRPDSSMNFTTDIVPSLIVRAGYGPPETAGMQLGAGVVRSQWHLRMAARAHPGLI